MKVLHILVVMGVVVLVLLFIAFARFDTQQPDNTTNEIEILKHKLAMQSIAPDSTSNPPFIISMRFDDPSLAPVNWQQLYLETLDRLAESDSLLDAMTARYLAWKAMAVRLDSTVRDMKIRTDERVAAWQARAVKFQDSLVFWNELYRTCKGRKSEPSFQSQLVQVKYWYNTAENRLRRGDWWKAQYDSLNYAPYICEACGDSINYPQPAPVQGYWDRAWSWIKSWLKLDDE